MYLELVSMILIFSLLLPLSRWEREEITKIEATHQALALIKQTILQ